MIVGRSDLRGAVGRWSPIAREAWPCGRGVRMRSGGTLRAERGEMLARPRQVGVAGPPLGQLEFPLTSGPDQLAGDRDHPTPERLGPLTDRPSQGLALIEHEHVEGQNL